MQSDARYFLRRASEEARRALRSNEPAVAEVHDTMSLRYSAKATSLLAEEDVQALPADRKSLPL